MILWCSSKILSNLQLVRVRHHNHHPIPTLTSRLGESRLCVIYFKSNYTPESVCTLPATDRTRCMSQTAVPELYSVTRIKLNNFMLWFVYRKKVPRLRRLIDSIGYLWPILSKQSSGIIPENKPTQSSSHAVEYWDVAELPWVGQNIST